MAGMTETVFETQGRIKLHRAAAEPVGRQLVRQLRTLITTGEVIGRTRLPSCTRLGEQLSVNRLTVASAYRVLQDEGLVEKRTGLGTFVTEHKPPSVARCTVTLCIVRTTQHGQLRHYDLVPQLFLEGVESYLSSKDISVNILVASPDDLDSRATERLTQRITRHEGVICVGGQFHRFAERLFADHFPTVVCRTVAGGSSRSSFVNYDRRKAFGIMTEHLIEQGCERIGFMGSRDNPDGSCSVKFAGYLDALESHGLAYDPCLRIDCPESSLLVEMQRQIVAESFEQGRIGDGLVCGGHGMGVSAVSVLSAKSVVIPDDVALVGNDDTAEAEHIAPTLTNLHIPRFEMGRAAAELLMELMLDGTAGPLERWVEAPLIVRQSSTKKHLTCPVHPESLC